MDVIVVREDNIPRAREEVVATVQDCNEPRKTIAFQSAAAGVMSCANGDTTLSGMKKIRFVLFNLYGIEHPQEQPDHVKALALTLFSPS
ncbi:MAG: hypothetical protein FJX25_14205 [Alphaproteobacteria bacterium]|nr:hypothetical protein [Alphaproteobacteria bacterium]